MSELKQLSDAATQGVWGIGGTDDGGAVGSVYSDDATGCRIADCMLEYTTFSYSECNANAQLIAALVNAYRAGRLVEAPAASMHTGDEL